MIVRNALRQLVLSGVFQVVLCSAGERAVQAAPTKDQCVDSYTRAQDLRRDGKLLDARAAFLMCTNEACPKLVRTDCIKDLEQLTSILPGIVFEARDGAGQDLSLVTVTMDGQPLVDHLDGSAIAIDPGAHNFVFQVLGRPPVELKLVIREGDRARRESVIIGPAPQPKTQSVPAIVEPTLSPAPESTHSLSTQRVMALVAAGVGASGLVFGSVFGGIAMSRKSDAMSVCPASCSSQAGVDAWNSAKSAGNLSTVGFIVAGVGLATGAVLWLTAKPEANANAGLTLGLAPGSMQVRGVW